MVNTEPAEFQDNPAALTDCKAAKMLPVGKTPPVNDAIQAAAHDLAVIPAEVKPSAGRMAAPTTTPPTPIAARREP